MIPLPHDRARELLGAYLDGELEGRLASRLRGHIDACERCRSALALQRGVRARTRSVPVPPASSALHARLAAALDAETRAERSPAGRPGCTAARVRAAIPWSGWAVAAALAVALALPRSPSVAPGAAASAERPPMVRAAFGDYRRVVAGELPGACDAPEALPFRGAPLAAGGAHALSCWTTTLQGQPVAAWAYRWRDRIVIAYVVPEALFFHPPVVREAVQREGRYAAADGRERVVGWPAADRGVLVVGDAAPEDLYALR